MPTAESREAAISRLLSHFDDRLTTAESMAGTMGISSRSVRRYFKILRERGYKIDSSSGVGTMLRGKND
jgi:predicted DNA-binding transcriptional regulator YafY